MRLVTLISALIFVLGILLGITYDLTTQTNSELLTDDQAFTELSSEVRSDIENQLQASTINDKATLRGLEKPDSLLAIVSELDSLYFSAHNGCDLQQIRSLLAPDVETFHDLGGYVQGRENFMEIMQQFCSNPKRTQRSLDSGTLEAYPMEGIGILHKADHHFYHINANGEKEIEGSGRMIMLWKRNRNNEWKIWDLISYDHGPAKR